MFLPHYLPFQPFWQVVRYSDSRGRGVVGKKLPKTCLEIFFLCSRLLKIVHWFIILFLGVLEANFIEPTHNKQEFERTSLFQKLEVRLKEMTWEYWLDIIVCLCRIQICLIII